MNEGVERGLWAPRRHPLSGVKVPESRQRVGPTRPGSGPHRQAGECTYRAHDFRPAPVRSHGPRRRVHRGPLGRTTRLAARLAVDIARQRLTVDLNCVENGRNFYFASPGKTNNPRPTRTVVLNLSTVSLLRAWMRDYSPRPTAPNVTGQMYPTSRSRTSPTATPYAALRGPRSSGAPPTRSKDGHPRPHGITSATTAPPGGSAKASKFDVSQNAGPLEDLNHNWYVNTDEESLTLGGLV